MNSDELTGSLTRFIEATGKERFTEAFSLLDERRRLRQNAACTRRGHGEWYNEATFSHWYIDTLCDDGGTFALVLCGHENTRYPDYREAEHSIPFSFILENWETQREKLKRQIAEAKADVVGPVCESGDFLARDIDIALPMPGDILAVTHVGAYGYAMASNYNSRCRPAEVLIDERRDDEIVLIRRRETYEDLVQLETL